jgi:hypothetical protein
MQPVIQEFTQWFTQFILVATIILIIGHIIGTKRRAQKKLKLEEEQSAT